MKKYKLIKEYPGSPPLDTIFKKQSTGHYQCERLNIISSYSASIIENYPEHFKEIESEDYDPLLFKINKDGSSSIASVKRLSDGVIFKIGDMVKHHLYKTHQAIAIRQFKKVGSSILIECDNHFRTSFDIGCSTPPLKPVFSDCLGNNLYEGDQMYSISRVDPKKAKLGNVPKSFEPSTDYVFFRNFKDSKNYLDSHRIRFSFTQIEKHLTKKGREALLKEL